MREIVEMPTSAKDACERVLAVAAYEIEQRTGVRLSSYKDIVDELRAMDEEMDIIIHLYLYYLLKYEVYLDSDEEIEVGTGLGGAFVDIGNEGRFCIENYLDSSWRAGGGSSELPQVQNPEDLIVFLVESDHPYLRMLGYIERDLDTQIPELFNNEIPEVDEDHYMSVPDTTDIA